MPWCDDCSKFWNAPDLGAGGACPSCGKVLAAGSAASASPPVEPASPPPPGPSSSTDADEPSNGPASRAKGAPWHFKLLVVGVTVYMVYRIYWLAEWLPKHI